MGLVMNVKPSMRQTLQGKALLSEARVTLNQKYYKNRGKFDEELSLAQTDKIKFEDTKKEVQFVDLTKILTGVKPESECTIEPTKHKLKFDEKAICEKLIRKYGDENFGKMAADIKVNYLQWSKG